MKDPIHHRGKLSKKVLRDARQEQEAEAVESNASPTTAVLNENEALIDEPISRLPLRRDPHRGYH